MDPEDFEHFDNILNGGLMRKVTPAHVEAKFLQAGYARKAVGGLMPTEIGYKKFIEMQGKR